MLRQLKQVLAFAFLPALVAVLALGADLVLGQTASNTNLRATATPSANGFVLAATGVLGGQVNPEAGDPLSFRYKVASG